MERLRNLIALLRSRIWIFPAVMSTVALALAFVVLGPGRDWGGDGDSRLSWLFSGDASSARDLLGALLTGTITMTSLVVSLTFVTLTLAATQLGPRLILNFIGDRQIQAVLGLFIGTILYDIAVMRTVGADLSREALPHLAITGATILTTLCMFALLFYVSKISRAIIADTVVAEVSASLEKAVSDFLPDDGQEDRASPPSDGRAIGTPVCLGEAGYIQTIDYAALVRWAEEHDAVLDVSVKAGDFVLRGGCHVDVRRAAGIPEEAVDGIREAIIVGTERSPAQDLEYSVRQLVEVALRALSTGVNDPFTAIAVIDRLGSAMELILQRPSRPSAYRDGKRRVRVLAARPDSRALADSSFGMIRQAAAHNQPVLFHLVLTLAKLAASCRNPAACDIVLDQIAKVDELADFAAPGTSDRAALKGRIARARTP